jgi:hypothetical protein
MLLFGFFNSEQINEFFNIISTYQKTIFDLTKSESTPSEIFDLIESYIPTFLLLIFTLTQNFRKCQFQLHQQSFMKLQFIEVIINSI